MDFSKETQDSLSKLMGPLKYFSELLERVSHSLSRHGIDSESSKMLMKMSDALKNFYNPNKFDSLEHFNQKLKSEMDTIGKALARHDWVTPNIRDNFMKLNKHIMPEFEESVLREKEEKKQLSQEDVFKIINEKILKKYNRAKVYADMFANWDDSPRSAGVWSYMVSLLEPLVELGRKPGLNVEVFDTQWQRVKSELPHLYDDMGRLNVAYDDVWKDMYELEDFTDGFLKEVMGKKFEHKVEQNETVPQNSLENTAQRIIEQTAGLEERSKAEMKEKRAQNEQTEIKNVDPVKEEQVVDKELHKSEPSFQKPTEQKTDKLVNVVPGAPTGLDLDKKQENKDVSEKPDNLMQREDAKNDKNGMAPENKKFEKGPTVNEQAIAQLKQIVGYIDRRHSEEAFKKIKAGLEDGIKKNLFSDNMVKMYRYMFNQIENDNYTAESAMLYLSCEMYNHIADLEDLERTRKEKPDNLMGREDAKHDENGMAPENKKFEKGPTADEQAVINALRGTLGYDAETSDARDVMKKMSSIMREAYEKGMVSEKLRQQYNDVLVWGKETENKTGKVPYEAMLERLQGVIGNQIDVLEAGNGRPLQSEQEEHVFDGKSSDKKQEKNLHDLIMFNENNSKRGEQIHDLPISDKYKTDEKKIVVEENKINQEQIVPSQLNTKASAVFSENNDKRSEQIYDLPIPDKYKTDKKKIVVEENQITQEQPEPQQPNPILEENSSHESRFVVPQTIELEKSDKRQEIEAFEQGTKKIQEMDAQQEEKSRNEIDRSAIAREAARRQKLLMSRK